MRLTRVVPVVAVALLGLGDGGPPAGRERVSAAQLKSSVRAAAGFADDSFGNGIFQVSVRRGGVGAGQFTVRTGPANPAGAGHDVLFGQGAPGTSYMIVRDTAAHVDYVQGQMLTHADEVSLDDFPNFTERSPARQAQRPGSPTGSRSSRRSR